MGELKPSEGRICAQPKCGRELAARNRSGYCAKHHDPSNRVEPRFCREPGCGQRLRSDNATEFCFAHRCQKLRSVAKACAECGKKLNADNDSGYCSNHYWLGRPCHARAVAKAAARPPCNEAGCQRAANKNGYCTAHRYAENRPSVKPQFCKASNCRAPLRSNNGIGYCRKHSYLARLVARRKCNEPGCQEVLGNNNRSGYCPVHRMKHYGGEHREVARARTEEWRARQQAKLAEAWRPRDFDKWPAAEQAIGSIVIRTPSLRARRIGQRFDDSKSPIRPPESWRTDSWERAFSKPGAGATWFSKLRIRLRKAGLREQPL
jgi:hypothetical protein